MGFLIQNNKDRQVAFNPAGPCFSIRISESGSLSPTAG